MDNLTQQIEELGAWAAGLELSAADPETPYWLRRQDTERAQRIRAEQAQLLIARMAASTTDCYPHANILGEGPNVSRRPRATWGDILSGTALALGLLLTDAAIASIAWALWRLMR